MYLNCLAVDGNWTEWSAWGGCSVTCAGGLQYSQRTCTNPAPQHGGADCDGSSSKNQPCSTQLCRKSYKPRGMIGWINLEKKISIAIHGNWAAWGSWTGCTKTCGGGTRQGSRTCTNPAPDHGGNFCPGLASQGFPCNTGTCGKTSPEVANAYSDIL